MTKDLAVDYQPVPLIRHQVKEKNPDVYPAKTTGGPQSQAPRKIFPHIQMGPTLLKEQLKIPKDVAESKQSKKRPAAQEKGQEIPSKAPRRATRSAAQSGSSAGPSLLSPSLCLQSSKLQLLLLLLLALLKNMFAPTVVTPLIESMILTII